MATKIPVVKTPTVIKEPILEPVFIEDIEVAADQGLTLLNGLKNWNLHKRLHADQIHFWQHPEVKDTLHEYKELASWVDRDPERMNSIVLLKLRKMHIKERRMGRLRSAIKVALVAISSTGLGAWLATMGLW